MSSVAKTVKIPKSLAAALSREARERDLTESELIREGIRRVVETKDGLDMEALIGPDVGIGKGPRDLSSNRKRLNGYGRPRHR